MFHYDKTEDYNGTSFQGYLTITFKELVEELGEPHVFHGDKTTVEWAFKTSYGAVFTIYDYKNEVTPTGRYAWHVGGRDERALEAVKFLFPTGIVVDKGAY